MKSANCIFRVDAPSSHTQANVGKTMLLWLVDVGLVGDVCFLMFFVFFCSRFFFFFLFSLLAGNGDGNGSCFTRTMTFFFFVADPPKRRTFVNYRLSQWFSDASFPSTDAEDTWWKNAIGCWSPLL